MWFQTPSTKYSIPITHPLILSLYSQIWSSRGVGTKLMRCIDRDEDDVTTVEEIMSFVIVITNPL